MVLASEMQKERYESAAMNALISTLPSVESQKYYPLRLKPFFDLAAADDANFTPGLSLDEKADWFVEKARANPKWALDILIKYVNLGKQRVNIKRDLAAGTLKTNFNTVRSFYECNDLGTITSSVPINWERIIKGLPIPVIRANDRSYEIDEIRKLVKHADKRLRMIVFIMSSSGIRAGALPDLRLKHVKPITKIDDTTGENTVVAAKLTVYQGTRDQYFSFVSPECYRAIEDYLEHRRADGEKITPDSLLVRDLYKTTDVMFPANAGLATNPRPLQAGTIEKLLSRALRKQHVRGILPEGERRYEYKSSHGLRKFYTNKVHSAGMADLHREYLLGHNLGIVGSYWKPEEQEDLLVNDYLKAIPFLTIDDSEQKAVELEQKVTQLTIKDKQQNSIIEKKLAEKEEEINQLKTQQKKTDSELQLIFEALKMAQTRADLIDEQRKIAVSDPQWGKAMSAADRQMEQMDEAFMRKEDRDAELTEPFMGGGDPEEEAKIIERVGNMRRQKNMTKTGRGRGRSRK